MDALEMVYSTPKHALYVKYLLPVPFSPSSPYEAERCLFRVLQTGRTMCFRSGGTPVRVSTNQEQKVPPFCSCQLNTQISIYKVTCADFTKFPMHLLNNCTCSVQ